MNINKNIKLGPHFRFILAVLLAVSCCLLTVDSIFAGTLSTAKVTINNSRAGQNAVSHTFSFTTATTGNIKTIEMLYCTTQSGSCTTPNGIDTTTASQGSISGLGASTTNAITNGTLVLTVTSDSSIASGTPITLPYSNITNPTTINSSFFVRITSKDISNVTIDSTTAAFAILTDTSIAISADVASTFSVAISPVITGSVNGHAINITSTTASSIPFGTLTSGGVKVAAHDVTVITNSTNGYVVTVKAANPPLTDGSNNIDNFTEPNSLPLVWTSPAGGTPNVNTGFLGYTTEDSSLCTGTSDRFTSTGGNKWAGFSPVIYEVICNSSAAPAGETTRIGWQAEVNGAQPAGNYTGDVVIVTTPTY